MTNRHVAAVIVGLIFACGAASAQIPSDAEIRRILADRVGPERIQVIQFGRF